MSASFMQTLDLARDNRISTSLRRYAKRATSKKVRRESKCLTRDLYLEHDLGLPVGEVIPFTAHAEAMGVLWVRHDGK